MYYSLNTPHRQNIQKVYYETLHIPISHILQSFVEVYLILLWSSNGVNWRKNAQPKHYWLCFIQGPYWGLYGQGGSLSDSSEELLQWGKGRARIYRHFCWKKQKEKQKKTCSQTSKDDRLLRKNKTSEVKDFSTFLCMRGCKILGSLKLFLRSASLLLGLVSSFSLSWIPLRGNQWGGVWGVCGWWLDGWQHLMFTEMTGNIFCPQW